MWQLWMTNIQRSASTHEHLRNPLCFWQASCPSPSTCCIQAVQVPQRAQLPPICSGLHGKARSASIAWADRQDTWAIANKTDLKDESYLGCKRLGLQSLVRCLFRNFTNQYKCTNLAKGPAEAVYTLSTIVWQEMLVWFVPPDARGGQWDQSLQCEPPDTMPKQEEGQAACSVPISLHLLRPRQLSICRHWI